MHDERDPIGEELLNSLREALAANPIDHEFLAEAVNDVLCHYSEQWYGPEDDYPYGEDDELMEQLQTQVGNAIIRHSSMCDSMLALPEKIDGTLYDVGFIYDEDRDDRVLVAIHKLKYIVSQENRFVWSEQRCAISFADIIAVAEHKGVLKIYTMLPLQLDSLPVCGDEWSIVQLVPYEGKWVEVDVHLMRNLLMNQRSSEEFRTILKIE